MIHGPNVKKLIVAKMSRDAIPDGSGLAAGIDFLSSPTKMVAGAKAAAEWVEAVIQLVRDSADPNPWRRADDEAIAGEILRVMDEKRKRQEC